LDLPGRAEHEGGLNQTRGGLRKDKHGLKPFRQAFTPGFGVRIDHRFR